MMEIDCDSYRKNNLLGIKPDIFKGYFLLFFIFATNELRFSPEF